MLFRRPGRLQPVVRPPRRR